MSDQVKQAIEKVKRDSATPTVSTVLPDGSLVEMVYRPEENRTLFCVSKDGDLRYEASLLANGQRLVPYSPRNNLLTNEVVLFPSEAAEYESEQTLVEEIRSFIHRYVDVSPLFEQIASYYVLFTWVYDSFNELPYLRLRGDTGSGKTRFLLTAGSLCYKPIFASGASTVSPLFRILDEFRGTLIVDEGDFRFSDEKAEIVKILNNGNGRGFPVLRSESVRGKEFSPRAYAVFGPKLVATRGYFQDRALESRCLTEEMGAGRLRSSLLRAWKTAAEARALSSIGKTAQPSPETEEQRKLFAILPWKGKRITLPQMSTGRAVTLIGAIRARAEVTLLDCNEFFVTIGNGGSARSISLKNVEVSFDNTANRLELQERYD